MTRVAARRGASRHGDATRTARRADLPAGGKLWCLEAEVPIGARARPARRGPQRRRSIPRPIACSSARAANIVGTTLETANVLEAARRKDEFLAMLGHELRNPLAPILTAVELLGAQPAAARERRRDRAAHAPPRAARRRSARHLARHARAHRAAQRGASRWRRCSSAPSRSRAPLVTRNRHTLERRRRRRRHAAKAIRSGSRRSSATSSPTPRSSRRRADGSRSSSSASAGRVRVTVRDNGRGIARDQLERIFEPFVQADRERDALRGGLGLGLAIVRNLVQRHGGTIAVAERRARARRRVHRRAADGRRVAEPPRAAVRRAAPTRARGRARAGRRRQRRHRRAPLRGAADAGLPDRASRTTGTTRSRAGAASCRTPACSTSGCPTSTATSSRKTLRAEHGASADADRRDRLRPAQRSPAGGRRRLRLPLRQAGERARPGVHPRSTHRRSHRADRSPVARQQRAIMNSVELNGIEPSASSMPLRRSPS